MTEEIDLQESQKPDEGEENTSELDEGEETNNTPTIDDFNQLKEEKQKLEEKNKQLYQRAKKAEVDKKLKTNSGITREEAILFAKGLTEEDIEIAHKIASVNNIPLEKAVEDDYLKSRIQRRQDEEKSKKASLGASGGSGSSKDISEMSATEHEEYARKIMSEL